MSACVCAFTRVRACVGACVHVFSLLPPIKLARVVVVVTDTSSSYRGGGSGGGRGAGGSSSLR